MALLVLALIVATAPGVAGGITGTSSPRLGGRGVVRVAIEHEEPALLSWLVLSPLLLGCAMIGVGGIDGWLRRGRSWAAAAPAAHELQRVQAIVQQYGRDSLAPFLVSPEKRFQFADGGVLGYRLIAETAVIAGDPVGPPGSAAANVAQLRARAQADGRRLVIYGGSAEHLAAYRTLGLRALCVGEEAVVDPSQFRLDGRAVRKLRQSVHRVERRGWQVQAITGREIAPTLEAEIDAVEAAWRAEHPQILGFAMSHGRCDPGVRHEDVYLLARSPEGDLRGVMRFLAHCGGLSLDTMRRVGKTPNGLNEALVCTALAYAADHGVAQVSLNYAGLSHLLRSPAPTGFVARQGRRCLIALLGRRFQMGRLVRFNEKFSPVWRPRYLIYESRRALPRSILRVLQAEGYLPASVAAVARSLRRPLLAAAAVAVLGVGVVGAYSYAKDYDLHRGFAALVQLPRAGTGRLENVRFYSPALHREAAFLIYLPPGYRPGRQYPVYYLLHGMPGQPRVFVDIANMDVRLDNQLSLGHVRPMILVYPDGRIGGNVFSDSEWANTPAGAYESYVMEVVQQVDRHYGGLDDRRDRVIGGFSAGAFGAVNIALHHLAAFANVQSWSGYFTETRSGVFAHASAGVLRYNSPIDYVGRLAHEIARDPLRADLFIGRDDSDASQLRPMVAALRAAGARVRSAVYPGGHDWAVWYPRLNQMLQSASRDFTSPPSARRRAPGADLRAPALRGFARAHVRATPRSTLLVVGALVLALLSAALINLGFVLQHRGRAMLGPDRSAHLAAAFTSRAWLVGQGVGWLGFAGSVLALALAPLTLVQAFAAGGLAVSVPVAARAARVRVSLRQLGPILVIAACLAVLPIGFAAGRDTLTPGALLAIAIIVSLIAVALNRLGSPAARAIASGGLYGIADAAIKADALALHHAGVAGLLSGWTVLAVLGTLGGFICFQAALRGRDPVQPIVLMTAFVALTSILAGVLAFGERLGATPLAGVGHAVAIAAVLGCVSPLARAQHALAPGGETAPVLPGSPVRSAPPVSLTAGPSQRPRTLARAARGAAWAGLVFLATTAACLAGLGLLYLLRGGRTLAAGPALGDSLPLLQLAGFAAQPLARVVVAWAIAGLCLSAILRRIARSRRLVGVSLIGGLLLLAGSDASYALAHNLALAPTLLGHQPGLGTWLEFLILAGSAALVVPAPLRDWLAARHRPVPAGPRPPRPAPTS